MLTVQGSFMFPSTRPGILFAMRYDNKIGYVWKTIRLQYEIAAVILSKYADCYISYTTLYDLSVEKKSNLLEKEIDLYSFNAQNNKKIGNFINEFNIKTIVFMSALPSTINLKFLHDLGIKTINTEHDSFDENIKQSFFKKYAKTIVRKILKKQLHTIHIANCKSQFKWLKEHAQIPSNRMFIVMNGVDSKCFYPGNKNDARKVLQLESNKFWVMLASQARSEKRVDKIIQVAADILNDFPELNIGFIYVGGGEYLNKWKLLANSLNLSDDKFLFAGEQTELLLYYQASDLFIHASERESFGLVLVEAMMCSLPVVATSAKGPNEIIKPDITGYITDQHDFKELKEKIVFYANNIETCKLHGKNARNHALEYFCINKNSYELARIISLTLD